MSTEKRARQKAARQARRAAEARRKRRRQLLRNTVIVLILAVVVVGSVLLITQPWKKSSPSSTTSTTLPGSSAQKAANAAAVAVGCPANPSTRVNTMSFSSAPPMTIDTSKSYKATVKTTAGNFVIALDAKAAPQTVNSFVFLANHGFYHCVIFHRVIPGFMDQTGDPTGTGTGGPGYTIPDEYPAKASSPSPQYPVGSVAMANTGQPHSGGSQFFVVTGPQGEALPPSYTLFGTVTTGMDVVQKINSEGNPNPSANGVPPKVVQRILSITISS